MAGVQLNPVIQFLRQTATAGDATDPHLLHRFVAGRDTAAFAALVRRHGPMVFGVCRRVLRHYQDAEDAFQATFLVLARKARGLGRLELLGQWLHGVAYRTALKAKVAGLRRAAHETTSRTEPAREDVDEVERRDLLALLDEEVHCLPGKYRTAVILCYLEGHSTEEAARKVGCPRGTILSRLARARERLRNRLELRGVALSVAALAVALAAEKLSAALPGPLAEGTTGAALAFVAGSGTTEIISARVAALTEGVLKTMAISKWKVAAVAVMALCLVGAVAGILSHRTEGAEQSEARTQPAAKDVAKKEPTPDAKTASDKDKLQGTWVSVELEQDGKKLDGNKALGGMRMTFEGDKVKVAEGEGEKTPEGTYTLDAAKSPKEIDLLLNRKVEREQHILAIYRLEDDMLTLCTGSPDSRPTEFATSGKAGKDQVIMIFKRSRADETQKMQGSWKVVTGDLKGGRVLFLDDRIAFEGDGGMEKASVQIDPFTSQAMTLTLLSGQRKGDRLQMLYALDGGELSLVLPRHTGWPGATAGKSGLIVLTLKRDRE